MNLLNRSLFLIVILSVGVFLFGCPANTTVTTNENANAENANAENTNVNAENTNGNTSESTSAIDVKEPENYQGKVNLKLEAMGEKGSAALPGPLTATVAKMGDNKRMEFNLNNQKIVYLELGARNLVLLPDRKQYAELNEQSTGFQVRSLMTPGQMVNQIKNLQGVEKVGEETVGGRTAVKYKYAAATQTNTKAGEVDTESFVLVDKETGLPLRTEVVSKADQAVNGYKGIRIITEMTDVQLTAAEDMFKEPTDFQKVEEAQIRQQVGLVFNAVSAFITQIIQSANVQ